MPETDPDRDAAFGRLADEFLERIRRGEVPTTEEYVRAHPEFAEELRQGLPLVRALTPPADSSERPESFGEFRIVRMVGRGGMGVVYEAVQEPLGRRVALKVLARPMVTTPVARERFRREARTAAGLHHSNIVPVFAVGEQDGVPFYAMQFIAGTPLDRLLIELRARTTKRGTAAVTDADSVAAINFLRDQFRPAADAPSDNAERKSHSAPPPFHRAAARLGLQTAEALAFAHGRGVLHRDIKPSNLMVDAHGTLWVTDFGLARTGNETGLTDTGDAVGTLRYMAPERFRGQADVRSDVYALGVTLYELLTLRSAFDGEGPQLVEQIVHGKPVPPRRVDASIPRDLETVVLKAMAPAPADRYQSAAALADDLRRFAEDRPVLARRHTWPEQLWRAARRNPVVAALMAAVLLLLVAGAIGAWFAAFSLRTENARTGAAERDAKEKLVRSLCDQVRTVLVSRRPGQRDEALAAVAQAAQLSHELGTWDREQVGLRSLAAAALVLPDLREEPQPIECDRGTTTFALDPAAEHVVGGDAQGRLIIRRTKDGSHVRVIPGAGALPYYLKFSRGGRFLAAQYVGQTMLHVWSLDSGGSDRRFPINGSMDFSPDCTWVAVPAPDGAVVCWDLAAGTERKRLAIGPGRHLCAIDPQGARVAITTQQDSLHLDVIDVRSRATVGTVALPSVAEHLAWSPEGRLVAVACGDMVHVWDTFAARWQCRLRANDAVTGVAFTADGLVAICDRHLRLWDPATGLELLETTGREAVLLPNLTGLVIAAVRDGDRLSLLSASREPVCRTLVPHRDTRGVQSLSWAPGGRILEESYEDGLCFHDVASGQAIGWLAERYHTAAAFDPTGQRLLTTGFWGANMRSVRARDGTIDLAAANQLGAIFPFRPLGECTFSPDGTTIAVPCERESRLVLHDLRTGSLRTMTGEVAGIHFSAFSPDGRWVAAAAGKTLDTVRVVVWDARTGEAVKHFESAEVPEAAAVHFSADGLWLVLSTAHEHRFWATGTWEAGPSLESSTWPTLGPIAFDPAGRLVAIGDVHSVRLLAAAGLGELVALPCPDQRITCLAFSSDGGRLAVGCDNCITHVWDLASLRKNLDRVGLDWDAPPCPALPAGPARVTIARPGPNPRHRLVVAQPGISAKVDRFLILSASEHMRSAQRLQQIGDVFGALLHSSAATWRDPSLAQTPLWGHAFPSSAGQWGVYGRELVQEDPRPNVTTSLYVGDPSWRDYNVEIEAAVTGGDGEFDIAFRAGPAAQLLAVFGGWQNTQHGIVSMRPTKKLPESVATKIPGRTEQGHWYRVRIEARGDSFAVYLDRRKLFDFNAAGFAKGGIGLKTVGSSARFRNLHVTDPLGRILFDGLPRLHQPPPE